MAVQKKLTYLLLLAGGCLAALALGWALLQTDETPTKAVEEAAVSIENATTSSAASTATLNKEENTAQNQSAEAEDKPSGDVSASAVSDDTASTDPKPEDRDIAFSLSLARITPDGYAVFAGTGLPETIIELLEDTQLLASTKTTNDGDWVAIPDKPLTPGTHLIIARMIKPDGSVELADMSVVVEIQADEADTPLVALVPQDETGTAQLLQMPQKSLAGDAQEGGIAAQQDTQLAENTIQTTTQQTGQQTGQQTNGAVVLPPALRILTLTWKGTDKLQVAGDMQAGRRIEAVFAGQNVASLNFKEMAQPVSYAFVMDATPLDSGPKNLVLGLFAETGEQLANTELMLSSDQLQSGLDGNAMVVIQKGDMLWRIAYRTYGSGVRYVDIVSRNQTQIVDPDLIYPNQIFALPQN